MKKNAHQTSRNFHIDPWPAQLGPQSSQGRQADSEADYFAACLLIGKYKLRELLSMTRDLPLIADYFGVPVELLKMRIRSLS